MSDETGPLALVVGGGSGIGAALVGAYRARVRRRWSGTWPASRRDVRRGRSRRDRRRGRRDPRRWGVPAWVTVTAGIGHAGMLTDVEPEEFDQVLR